MKVQIEVGETIDEPVLVVTAENPSESFALQRWMQLRSDATYDHMLINLITPPRDTEE